MRRAQGLDGARLFNVAAKVQKQLPDDCDVQASEEEINFTTARNLA